MGVLVTGGAGFIGSNLVDRLVKEGSDVTVFDNLSSGRTANIESFNNTRFIKGDLLNPKEIEEALSGISKVYHLAANPEVRLGQTDTKTHFDQNILATYNLLEAMRIVGVKKMVFTSTSAVYGDADVVPTPESYAPTPISTYGASKSAAESMISSFCHTFGMQAVVLRFANVVGRRSGHGVIIDFIRKLKANPSELEILGNGTQRKSYVYIDDCLDGLLFADRNAREGFEVFNLGSKDSISVKELADIVASVMKLSNVRYRFTGGDRGWKGDVKFMQLSLGKIKELGWEPKFGSKEAVRKTVEDLESSVS